MRTALFIKRLLPLLGSVRGAGVFNNALAAQMSRLSEELREAQNVDQLDFRRLVDALQRLADANAFELQQSAIVNAICVADQTLDAMTTGELDPLAHPVETVASLRDRISQDIARIASAFRVPAAVSQRMRVDASQLCALTANNESIGPQANVIFDLVDRLDDLSARERPEVCDALLASLGRMAA